MSGLDEQWVIWNGNPGILAMVTIGRVEEVEGVRQGWLERPFDMVGPFNLDDLLSTGRLAFAACIVMSRQRWQEDQRELRQEAHERRRAAQAHMHESQARFHRGRAWRLAHGESDAERQHRETLKLPADGALKPAQIKAAYRRLAQRAHPDAGGSHEAFVRITAARNGLLELVAQGG
jgi:hypothetical protein